MESSGSVPLWSCTVAGVEPVLSCGLPPADEEVKGLSCLFAKVTLHVFLDRQIVQKPWSPACTWSNKDWCIACKGEWHPLTLRTVPERGGGEVLDRQRGEEPERLAQEAARKAEEPPSYIPPFVAGVLCPKEAVEKCLIASGERSPSALLGRLRSWCGFGAEKLAKLCHQLIWRLQRMKRLPFGGFLQTMLHVRSAVPPQPKGLVISHLLRAVPGALREGHQVPLPALPPHPVWFKQVERLLLPRQTSLAPLLPLVRLASPMAVRPRPTGRPLLPFLLGQRWPLIGQLSALALNFSHLSSSHLSSSSSALLICAVSLVLSAFDIFPSSFPFKAVVPLCLVLPLFPSAPSVGSALFTQQQSSTSRSVHVRGPFRLRLKRGSPRSFKPVSNPVPCQPYTCQCYLSARLVSRSAKTFFECFAVVQSLNSPSDKDLQTGSAQSYFTQLRHVLMRSHAIPNSSLSNVVLVNVKPPCRVALTRLQQLRSTDNLPSDEIEGACIREDEAEFARVSNRRAPVSQQKPQQAQQQSAGSQRRCPICDHSIMSRACALTNGITVHPLDPLIATSFANNSFEKNNPLVDWDHGSLTLPYSDHCYKWQAVYSDAEFHDESAPIPLCTARQMLPYPTGNEAYCNYVSTIQKLSEEAQPKAIPPPVLSTLQDFPDIRK
ncbi:hypothetical protein Efla_001333 [Eimeria flavescens]